MMEKSRDSLKLENIARVPFSSIFEAYICKSLMPDILDIMVFIHQAH